MTYSHIYLQNTN